MNNVILNVKYTGCQVVTVPMTVSSLAHFRDLCENCTQCWCESRGCWAFNVERPFP